jgi:hypothetical protein
LPHPCGADTRSIQRTRGKRVHSSQPCNILGEDDTAQSDGDAEGDANWTVRRDRRRGGNRQRNQNSQNRNNYNKQYAYDNRSSRVNPNASYNRNNYPDSYRPRSDRRNRPWRFNKRVKKDGKYRNRFTRPRKRFAVWGKPARKAGYYVDIQKLDEE